MDVIAGGRPATAGTETLLRRWVVVGPAKREIILMVAIMLTLSAAIIWAWGNAEYQDLPPCAPVVHVATDFIDFPCSPGPPVAQ